jgi:phage baseplate assembly protein W
MNPLIQASIAEQIATLQQVVDAPIAPLGYGTDLSCITDLAEDLAEVDPTSNQAIAEALIRRLITPRGALPDDPDYGFDLRGLLNRGVTLTELRAVTGQARNEIRKDDRVADAKVSAAFSLQGATLRVSIEVTPADVDNDTFSFTFALTDTTVAIEVIG